jgi:hypothetical protein
MATITFGRWVRYLTREWRHDGDMDELIGFAIRMATFTPDGGTIYVLVPTLAQLSGLSERTAQRRRAQCIRLGMFRRTGKRRRLANGGWTEELALACPQHMRSTSDVTGCSTSDVTGRIERRQESDVTSEPALRAGERSSAVHSPSAPELALAIDPAYVNLNADDLAHEPGLGLADDCRGCGRIFRGREYRHLRLTLAEIDAYHRRGTFPARAA